MTRRAPLPKITECVEKQKTVNRVTRMHLLRGSYPFLVICALCLAHIHLQFARIDILVQESHLQSRQRVLLRELAVLERQTEEIDIEALKDHGRREMGMQESANPSEDLLVQVPLSVQKKYLRPLGLDHEDVVVAELRNTRESRGGIKEVLLSLLEGGRAMASVATERP